MELLVPQGGGHWQFEQGMGLSLYFSIKTGKLFFCLLYFSCINRYAFAATIIVTPYTGTLGSRSFMYYRM